MSDIYKAITQAFGVMGLKARSAATIVETLRSKYQVECSDEGGFLALIQNGAQANVAQILQAYFKQNPADFVGHSGTVNFKSDVKDDAAKSKYITDHGYDAWAALPVNEKSPSARNVVKPTILSTEMTQKEWLTLTPKERCEAISGWGKAAVGNVERIMARRK